MNHDDSLSNLSMLELFRLEVETQAALLSNHLLALETSAQPTKDLEILMRAAHSIKGAARIVGLDTAVTIAHALEDYLVAAQNGKVVIQAAGVDISLQAVDWLLNLSQQPEANIPHWLIAHAEAVDALVAAIATVAQASPEPTPDAALTLSPTTQPTLTSQPPGPTPGTPPPTPAAIGDRVVRVSAENLNRLMGLAGETLVDANWLQPFAKELEHLRQQQTELVRSLEQLQAALPHQALDARSDRYLQAARHQATQCAHHLGDRLTALENYSQRTANRSDRLYRAVLGCNMRPFADGIQAFPRMVRDLAKHLGKQVKLAIIGETTAVDRDILERLEAPLTHLLRNAIDHGIEAPEERMAQGKPAIGTIRLEASHRGGMLSVTVADDGQGINLHQLRATIVQQQRVTPDLATQLSDAELLEFLFLPGFSTVETLTELSGRGVGLDVVQSTIRQIGGTLRASANPDQGTEFHLQLPLTLSVLRTLLVEIAGEAYALPLSRLDHIALVPQTAIALTQNHPFVLLNEHAVGLIAASQILELDDRANPPDPLPIVVINDAVQGLPGDRAHRYGLVVDRFLGERDLVVRPLDPRLGKVKNISAAALREDGSLVLLLDPEDLLRSIETWLGNHQTQPTLQAFSGTGAPSAPTPKRILVVEDSITVREMERKLLQNRGYQVDVAVNGVDGWNALRAETYDLLITDVDMPRMNGIELIRQLKQHPDLKTLPVIIVSYKDREEDYMQGLEVGANRYLTKSSFHDDSLLKAVDDLIGEAIAG